MFTAMFWV